MKRFIIGGEPSNLRDDIFSNLITYLNELPEKKKYSVEIKEYRKARSLDQNAYLHAVPMKLIAEHSGHSAEEIREFLCGEFTGWKEHDVFGKRKVRPVKTTSEMTTKEMTDFIEFLQWWAQDNLDLRIPSPNEV